MKDERKSAKINSNFCIQLLVFSGKSKKGLLFLDFFATRDLKPVNNLLIFRYENKIFDGHRFFLKKSARLLQSLFF